MIAPALAALMKHYHSASLTIWPVRTARTQVHPTTYLVTYLLSLLLDTW